MWAGWAWNAWRWAVLALIWFPFKTHLDDLPMLFQQYQEYGNERSGRNLLIWASLLLLSCIADLKSIALVCHGLSCKSLDTAENLNLVELYSGMPIPWSNQPVHNFRAKTETRRKSNDPLDAGSIHDRHSCDRISIRIPGREKNQSQWMNPLSPNLLLKYLRRQKVASDPSPQQLVIPKKDVGP